MLQGDKGAVADSTRGKTLVLQTEGRTELS